MNRPAGNLRVQKAIIILIHARPAGIELVLNLGMSIAIRTARLMQYQPQDITKMIQFIEMGASFPSLNIRYLSCPDFIPRAFVKPKSPPVDTAAAAAAPAEAPAGDGHDGDMDGVVVFPEIAIQPLIPIRGRGGR